MPRVLWVPGLIIALAAGLGVGGCRKAAPQENASGSKARAGMHREADGAMPQAPRPRAAGRSPARPVAARRPATRPADPDPAASVLPREARLPADVEQQLARKRLLSFPSRWNGKVHVRQTGRVRLLYLGKRMDIVHTRLHLDRPADLISPYQQCLLLGFGLFEKPRTEVKRVAMIGLGGGALTRFFRAKRPELVFHSVEIDPVVVAVARRLFGVKDTPGYRSYAMDGRRFLQEAKRPYDVIIMDAFDAAATLPKQLASQEFFRLLKARLTPHGVLLMNFLVHDRRIYASVWKTLKTVFPRVYRMPLRRFRSFNTLLLAAADPRRMPDKATLRGRIPGLKSSYSVAFPLKRCWEALDADRLDLKAATLIRDPTPARGAP
ncbi:MAG: fused MFS/spermidine synthase [bacterium]